MGWSRCAGGEIGSVMIGFGVEDVSGGDCRVGVKR